jgi:hypothetical protein
MFIVKMERNEWNVVIEIISTLPMPWVKSNPLLMTISQQLREQDQQQAVSQSEIERSEIERQVRAADLNFKGNSGGEHRIDTMARNE